MHREKQRVKYRSDWISKLSGACLVRILPRIPLVEIINNKTELNSRLAGFV